MVIYGTKGKKRTIGRGYFYCPRCQVRRFYKHIKVSKYFSLYFIALIPVKNLGEYIECQTCFTPFETSVLELEAPQQRDNDVAKKFITHVKHKMNEGLSIQHLYASLVEEGLEEQTIKTILAVVTEGKIMLCETCEHGYIETLKFCPNCGSALSRKVFGEGNLND